MARHAWNLPGWRSKWPSRCLCAYLGTFDQPACSCSGSGDCGHGLHERVKSLSDRNPGVFVMEQKEANMARRQEEFVSIRPGGQREPLIYDPKGYFVITIEPEQGEILLRHYLPDHTPAHEMRGRGATSMLLGLLRDGL